MKTVSRGVKLKLSVEALRAASVANGTARITMKEVNAEIAAVRVGRGRKGELSPVALAKLAAQFSGISLLAKSAVQNRSILERRSWPLSRFACH